jgi:hypothetical protein
MPKLILSSMILSETHPKKIYIHDSSSATKVNNNTKKRSHLHMVLKNPRFQIHDGTEREAFTGCNIRFDDDPFVQN